MKITVTYLKKQHVSSIKPSYSFPQNIIMRVTERHLLKHRKFSYSGATVVPEQPMQKEELKVRSAARIPRKMKVLPYAHYISAYGWATWLMSIGLQAGRGPHPLLSKHLKHPMRLKFLHHKPYPKILRGFLSNRNLKIFFHLRSINLVSQRG